MTCACRRRGGDDDLEQRARRVDPLHGPVQERPRRILHQREPRLAVQRPREPLDGVRRVRGQGEHVAVARIHDHDRARARAERVLGRLLDPPVDRRPHVRAGHRLLPVEDPDQSPVGVHLDLLAAVPAPEVLVVEPLEPGLPDEIAPARAVPPEILVRGLAHVAEEVGREADARVGALGLDLDRHARQIEPPLLDPGDLLERESRAPAGSATASPTRHAPAGPGARSRGPRAAGPDARPPRRDPGRRGAPPPA